VALTIKKQRGITMDQERKYKDRIAQLLLDAAKGDNPNVEMSALSTEFAIALSAISLMVSDDETKRKDFLNTCSEVMFDAERELSAGRIHSQLAGFKA
jgi:hypothetical protein